MSAVVLLGSSPAMAVERQREGDQAVGERICSMEKKTESCLQVCMLVFILVPLHPKFVARVTVLRSALRVYYPKRERRQSAREGLMLPTVADASSGMHGPQCERLRGGSVVCFLHSTALHIT